MKLFSFLVRYSPGSAALAVLIGILSGASNAALLAVFNSALNSQGHSDMMLIWSFIGLCALLPVTRFTSEIVLAHLAQGALFNLRMRLCSQMLAAPLRHIEELGAHRMMTALADDVPVITGTLVTIPLLCINIAVAAGGLIYLGLLSWPLLLTVLGFMALGITTYQFPVIKSLRFFRHARETADKLFRHFRDLTEGTKELKLHRRRREVFLSKVLKSTAGSLREDNLKGITIYTAAASWGQVLVFVVIGLVLFVMPRFQEVTPQSLTGYTLTLLYLMTPFQVVMNTLPGLGRANVSLQKVEELGLELLAKGTEDAIPVERPRQTDWKRLELSGVTHSYRREGETDEFTLGPIDLTLTRGEMVFLVGGNGSGKTTLAKLLAGLYAPESGRVLFDGEAITEENREFYRQHFSMVFSDFHLFDSLLGLESPTIDDKASEYLARFQLSNKVEVKDGALSTTDLSQGQRKRLALLTAYLEDRPLYIFDEWAADQDPVFKRLFYYELLEDLRKRGKTLIVISHDDHYYDVGDRIIKLEYGRIEYDRPVPRPKQGVAGASMPLGRAND